MSQYYDTLNVTWSAIYPLTRWATTVWPNGTTTYTANLFQDGYRQLNISGGTKYIDPFDGVSILPAHSSVHNKNFTQKLSFPFPNNYSSYFLHGIYMKDSNWYDADSYYNHPEYKYYANTFYRFNNGEQFGSGVIVIKILRSAWDNSAPIYDYSTNEWEIVGTNLNNPSPTSVPDTN